MAEQIEKEIKSKIKPRGQNLDILGMKQVSNSTVLIKAENKACAERIRTNIHEFLPQLEASLEKKLCPRIKIRHIIDEPQEPRNDETTVEEIIANNFPDCGEADRKQIKIVKKFKASNTGHYDLITNEIIKNIVSISPSVLLDLFNDCYRTSAFPDAFKTSSVVLIPKSTYPKELTEFLVPKLITQQSLQQHNCY